MAFQIVQGRTNNHITWVGVDSTDFATRESALSAAWKIKIYGTLETAAGVNLVSSGTGSLTNDITHVGASATGVYHIALVKADISDASAAMYDEYIVVLSATGAAYETLILEGVRTDTSYLSNILSNLSAIASDIYSALLLVQSAASDAASGVSDLRSLLVTTGVTLTVSSMSDIASQVWAHAVGTRVDSRILLNQSRISDTYSMLSDFLSDFQSRVPKAVATNSQLSDLHSDLRSYLVVMSGVLSDTYSLLSDTNSDLRSLLVTTGVALTASAMSDIASQVWAHAVGTRVDSRVLLTQSQASDVYSMLSDFYSDFQSRVPKRVATDSQLSDLHSDLRSYLAVMSGVQSDVYSAVSDLYEAAILRRGTAQSGIAAGLTLDAGANATDNYYTGAGIVLVGGTGTKQTPRLITGYTGATKRATVSPSWTTAPDNTTTFIVQALATTSSDALSKVQSDLRSYLAVMSDILSNVNSMLLAGTFVMGASNTSDVASAVWAHAVGTRVDSRVLLTESMASDAASAAQQGNSRALVIQSMTSDVYSLLSDTNSDLRSLLVTTGIALTASAMSDIASQVWAHIVGTRVDSRVLLTQSQTSDAYSMLSDFYSDFQSRVPKRVATDSQLSDLVSDLRSYLVVMSGILSDTYSAVSDLRSYTLTGQSDLLSNIYSAAQRLGSAFVGQVGTTSSQVTDASQLEIDGIDHDDQFNGYYVRILDGSQVGELRLITDTVKASSHLVVQPAFLSRLLSNVGYVIFAGNPWQSRMHSDLRSYLVGMSGMLSDTYSLLSDTNSDLRSLVTAGVGLTTSAMSDIASQVWAHAVGTRVDSRLLLTQSMASDAASAAAQANSRVLLNQSQISDVYSMLSDFYSDFQSRVPKLVATNSQVSDLYSDLRSYLTVMSGVLSDTYSGIVALSDATSNAYSAAVVGASRILLVQSRLSDFDSRLVSDVSDILSAIAGITATVSVSDISDIASAVWANAIGARVDSRVLLNLSRISDVYSLLSDTTSDLLSLVTVTGVQLNASTMSDLRSAIAGVTATLSVSDISDIASAVWADTIGARVDSRLLLNQSRISDVYSMLSDFCSDFQSRVPKLVATNSQVSDLASDLRSYLAVMSGVLSDTYSLLSDANSDLRSLLVTTGVTLTTSAMSDIASQVWAHTTGARVDSRVLLTQSMTSVAASAAQQGNSRALVIQSLTSDVYSLLSDTNSDLRSLLVTTGIALTASAMSDIASQVWAHTVGTRIDSRLLLNQSRISDTYSMLSDLYSDFQSRVPKLVATDSQVSDLASDLRSYLVVMSGVLSDVYSGIVALSDATSNAYSAAVVGASRTLLVQSRLSDLDSRLTSDVSDILSTVQGNSDALSDLLSRLNSASFLSDIASHVWAAKYTTNSAPSSFGSLMSDLYSRAVVIQSAASDAASAAQQANSRVLLNQSLISDIYSLLSDVQSDFQSRVPKRVATDSQLSDLHSDLRSYLAVMSGILSDAYSGIVALSDATSNAYSAAVVGASRILLVQSRLSDFDSRLVSDLSDVISTLALLRSAFIGHTGTTASEVTDPSTLEIGGIDHDDQFNGYFIKILGGSQVDELRLITDTILGTSKIVVQPAFNSRLASGVGFVIVVGNPYQYTMQSLLSDVYSALLVTQSAASDAASAAQQTNSRVFLNQSRISDVHSLLSDFYSDFQSRVPKLVATNSQVSDLISDIRSYLVGMSGMLSDTYSQLSHVHSDIISALGNIAVTLTASDLSDIASAVVANLTGLSASDISNIASAVQAILASDFSDIISATQQTNSRVLLNQSRISDTYSMLSDFYSDFQSRVPKRVATDSFLSDVASDLRSLLAAGVALTTSAMSDIASQVWAHTVGTRIDSRVLLIQSQTSDIYSLASDLNSDLRSLLTTTGVQLNASSLSDLRSAIAGITIVVSASDISDIASAVAAALGSDLSDILSAAQQTNSRVLVNESRISDVYSLLSDFSSDFQSRVPKLVATNSQLSDLQSDIRSYLTGMSATLSDVYSLLSDTNSDLRSLLTITGVQLNTSSLSDIRSAITAAAVTLDTSTMSDIASQVWAHAVGVRIDSRVLLNLSQTSDVYSLLSHMQSDFQSRVPAVVATNAQLSDLASDLKSYLTGISALESDIYSLLSDLQSDFQSRVPKAVATSSQLSDLHSDVRSYLVSMSGMLSATHSAAAQTNSRTLILQSATSDIYSLLSDVSSDIGVITTIENDVYSLLSSLDSDIQSRFPAMLPELTSDPGATPTWAAAAALQYMWLKNNSKTTTTKRYLRNNAGATVLSATIAETTGASFVQGKLG